MAVTLLCPRLTCRAVLRVPDNVRGKHVQCCECGMTLLVPELPNRPTRPPPPTDQDEPTEQKRD